MYLLRSVMAIGVAAFVSACFMSEAPFIPEEEAVRLDEARPVLICTEADDCSRTIPDKDGNGYVMMPPPGENDPPMPVKFAPLMETALGTVWLAEFNMTEDDENAYIVGVVRRAPEYNSDGLEAFDVALPWCDDVSDEEAEAYGIEKLDQYTCALPAKTSISDYLRQTHVEAFEDPDWWEDN